MHIGVFKDIKWISQYPIQKNQKISEVSVLKIHKKINTEFSQSF
jgi:hypothetical protein